MSSVIVYFDHEGCKCQSKAMRGAHCLVREHDRGRLYSHCLPVKVEMCFVAPQSGGKLQTHLSLCAKMQRSVTGFLHDKLTESNVFPRPHPFTPAPPGKITKQGEKERKEGLERAT